MIFKFSTAFYLVLLLLAHVAHAIPHDTGELSTRSTTTTTMRAAYDLTYDVSSTPLNGVACSNATNSLVVQYPTFGDIPNFPFIGGILGIVFNSPNFGGCYKLTNKVLNVSIYIIAVDSTRSGVALSREAFTELSGGQIVAVYLTVVVEAVDSVYCKL